jgi:hypothetical protein
VNARLVASLLTFAAGLSAVLVVAAPGNLRWQAQPGTACDDLVALQQSLDLTSIGDQAVIRARAVQLAAALTAGGGQAQEGPEILGDALRLRILDRLQQVLDDSQATSRDLATALAPLAARCGIVLP